jgi:regulatory protein
VTNVTYLPWVASGSAQADPEADAAPHDAGRGDNLPDSDPVIQAEEDLVRALRRRDLTVGEASAFLRERELSGTEVGELVEKFLRLGYLDDERIANHLVAKLSGSRGKSRSVISRELSQRQLSADVISNALEGLDPTNEGETATRLALQRVAQFSSLDDVTAQRRLVGFLSRRGFSGSALREATDAAMATRHGRGG